METKSNNEKNGYAGGCLVLLCIYGFWLFQFALAVAICVFILKGCGVI